jgi:hypothetical protein
LELLFEGFIIEDDVKISAIPGAGVGHLTGQVFSATDRTTIAFEFVHIILLWV